MRCGVSNRSRLRRSAARGALLAVGLVLASAVRAGAAAEIFSEDFESGGPCGWPVVVGGASCPGPYTVGFCRLQFPTLISENEGTIVQVYGHLYVAGVTDTSAENDPDPEISGDVGYGPDASDPASDPAWVWIRATPNPAYGTGSPGHEPNNDEYFADLTVPSADFSPYDFAFRFSGDSRMSFTYCDGGNGSADGYSPADAGQMSALSRPDREGD